MGRRLLACEAMVGEAVEYIVGGTRSKLKAFPEHEKVLDEAPNYGYTYPLGENRKMRNNWTEQIAGENVPINKWWCEKCSFGRVILNRWLQPWLRPLRKLMGTGTMNAHVARL